MRVYDINLTYTLLRAGENVALSDPEMVARYLDGMFDHNPTVESSVVIPINQKGHPLGRLVISTGTATNTFMNVREIFKPVILAGATGLFIAHNHPSGDPTPSKADISITRQLWSAANLLGFQLRDHLIIGVPEADPKGRGWYSFSDGGLL